MRMTKAQPQERVEELERLFDLHWKASQRAIKMWQAANPGNDHVWPDAADLCVWLMDRIVEGEKPCGEM